MTSFKYKLYPNDHSNIDHQINVACFIYNHCIALKKRFYRRFKKSLGKNQLQKHLSKIKHRKRFAFFGELNSQTIQDITDRIERGYQAFFRKQNRSIPDFKGKKRYNSITFKQTGYKYLGGNKVCIMGKTFSFFQSRPVEGMIKTVTVKRDSLGDHYICFVTDFVRKISKPATCEGCGFDFGIKTFLATSDEEKIESPLYLKRSLKKLELASKKMSSKVKGSGRWNRARLDVARIHRRIHNQRVDFIFKLTKELVERYSELYFEDLNMKGMQKLWGRKVSDIANGMFMNIMQYRCEQYDRVFGQIDRFDPSTPICNICGCKVTGLTLEDRSWTCPQCGAVHDRDINAAKVIYKKGKAKAFPKTGMAFPDTLGEVRQIVAKQEFAFAV